jgi:pSer/pThr/pTyr-binding forkhead associated (FHA) protein
MVELWLTYKDPTGSEQRIAVDTEKFTIGRHSENDLSIADARLSRDHALIERFGDIFILSDKGSSNGTEINGQDLAEPTALKDGDVVSFGGLEAKIEIPLEDKSSQAPTPEAASTPPVGATPAATPTAVETGIPKSFFIIAPIFAVIVIGGVGLLLYMGSGTKPRVDNIDPTYSRDLDSTPTPRKNKKDDSDDPGPKNSDDVTSTNPTPVSSNGTSIPTPAAVDPEIAKTENNASAFLRKIAQNDPRAFVIGEPAKIVLAKIKSVSGNAALAANIGSARRNSAQIKTLAASKNLKPDLLAAAAIAKLGNSSGDVLQTAQSMAVPLDKLSTQLSSEFGEDCLLIIAAYDQGAAGDFLKMRNMLQDLATKMPDLNQDIRTIWWLKKQNKISDSEYEFAVRFLAVGTIAQNPKDFGVNAEALTFN